ncbi:MAG: tRNA pseudouridine(55) synthase TruB [Spirochaetales bacterium]|nr:tRNA pseudouridine(55) synthase TruB [Spirochaetales bacterium]
MLRKKNNLVLLYKPENISSFKALYSVKRGLGMKKVGHTGTLDPFACGLMVVLTGQYTKLAQYFEASEKRYRTVVKLGVETDTLDTEGDVVATSEYLPSIEEIKDSVARHLGVIQQMPPIYSAIKIDGRRAYDYARSGKEIEMKSREVFVKEISILNYEDGLLELDILCGKGTYIRSLARDIAKGAGTVGHLVFLERTMVGGFFSSDAVVPDEFDSSKVIDVSKDIFADKLGILSLDLKQEYLENVKHGKALRDEFFYQKMDDEALYSVFLEERFIALVRKGTDNISYEGVFLEDEDI